MRKNKVILCIFLVLLLCAGCGKKAVEKTKKEAEPKDLVIETEESQTENREAEKEETEKEETKPEDVVEEQNANQPQEELPKGYLVVIDAGHQKRGNSEHEPIGPGSEKTKPKVASGTQGVATRLPEYELTLQVSLKLRDELRNRGYDVLMVREKNDVNISNAERAKVANDAKADAFIRVHANGSENRSVRGMLTICQTSANRYNGKIYEQSKKLATKVLEGAVTATGARKERVWETDTMSGINWAEVPATIIEMGYMSNPEEDKLLATEEYQRKIVEGIANGIDEYFGE